MSAHNTHVIFIGNWRKHWKHLEHWNTDGQPSSAQRFAVFQSCPRRFARLEHDWNTRSLSSEFGRSVRLHGTELLENGSA